MIYMIYRKPKPKVQLEKAGSDRLRDVMHRDDWYTKKTHGTMFSKDWPDLWACHPVHGQRWIETKTRDGFLSDGQVREFYIWSKHNVMVWVLRDEKDYPLLFKDANWWQFALPVKQRPL